MTQQDLNPRNIVTKLFAMLEKEHNENHSCLVLEFYLANWNMYRGSSFLLKKITEFIYHYEKGFNNMNRRT